MTTFSPADVLAAEQGIRTRTIELLRSLSADQVSAVVPTCPDWSVLQLACHMYGVTDDILNGRLDGAGSDAWTAAQVARHEGKGLAQLCDEWEASAEAFDAVMLAIPSPVNLQVVMDMFTHEHDIRLALGRPGAQDDGATHISHHFLLTGLRGRNSALADAVSRSEAPAFDLARAMSGRRSSAQLEVLGLPITELIASFEGTPFTLAATDIVETI